jgi:hypothetical protein
MREQKPSQAIPADNSRVASYEEQTKGGLLGTRLDQDSHNVSFSCDIVMSIGARLSKHAVY